VPERLSELIARLPVKLLAVDVVDGVDDAVAVGGVAIALLHARPADLTGKTVALFGCGDSEGYSDTFCGGMAELYQAVKDKGTNIVGTVATDGYTYDDSEAVVDGKFVGLALDDVNEDDKTDARIDAWVAEIQPAL